MQDQASRTADERRPNSDLLFYYALQSLLLGPFFPFLLVPRFVRYRTLRYSIDDEGITVRWGAFFRREISLTYGRIQDIHLSSNLVERWLGLARIQVQTAAGSADAEMTIEGLPDAAEIRDLLYQRMRGARRGVTSAARSAAPTLGGAAFGAPPSGSTPSADEPADELTRALLATAAELRALREEIAAQRGTAPASSGAENEEGPAAESAPSPAMEPTS